MSYMTVTEAAEHLGVTRQYVDQLIRQGKIHVRRTIAGIRLVHTKDVLNIQAQRKDRA